MLYFKRIENNQSREWTVFVHGAGGSSAVWYKQVKAFSENFNVLLLDLRGHGKSKEMPCNSNYTFEMIADDVVKAVQKNNIKEAHFIGVSLGSIIINQIYIKNPEIVKSMIFSGAITSLNVKSRLLLRMGRIFNSFMPYMTLYKLLAQILMPRKNHAQSRVLFINEAKKLMNHEFKRWFKLTARLTKYLNYLQDRNVLTKGLYVMGSEDHLFLEPARQFVNKNENLKLEVVQNCGHVVNVEQADIFNRVSIDFIKAVS